MQGWCTKFRAKIAPNHIWLKLKDAYCTVSWSTATLLPKQGIKHTTMITWWTIGQSQQYTKRLTVSREVWLRPSTQRQRIPTSTGDQRKCVNLNTTFYSSRLEMISVYYATRHSHQCSAQGGVFDIYVNYAFSGQNYSVSMIMSLYFF